ncbi:MAG: hypothetical protein ACP5KY_03960 [Thermoproteus sp.]
MRRSAEDLILTTAAVRAGVEACVDLVDAVAERVGVLYLPIPVEVCRGAFADLGALRWILEPLLYIYRERPGRWACYGSLEDLRRRAFATARLAGLVVRAKVFGSVDLRQWDLLFASPPYEPPRPSLAIGYWGRDAVVCGAPTPTPLELAAAFWSTLEEGEKRELVGYVVEYIDLLLSSINIDEAYSRLVADGRYRAFADAVVHRVGNRKRAVVPP